MAKFLNTSAINYYLEELIKAARERLIRISDEVRLSAAHKAEDEPYDKLTTSKPAKAFGMRTGELNDTLIAADLLTRDGDEWR